MLNFKIYLQCQTGNVRKHPSVFGKVLLYSCCLFGPGSMGFLSLDFQGSVYVRATLAPNRTADKGRRPAAATQGAIESRHLSCLPSNVAVLQFAGIFPLGISTVSLYKERRQKCLYGITFRDHVTKPHRISLHL